MSGSRALLLISFLLLASSAAVADGAADRAAGDSLPPGAAADLDDTAEVAVALVFDGAPLAPSVALRWFEADSGVLAAEHPVELAAGDRDGEHAVATAFELPADTDWRLEVASERYWAEPRSVRADDGVSIRLELRPAAALRGRVADTRIDGEATLFVRVAEDDSLLGAGTGRRSYDLECPLAGDGAWRCTVPAGRLHVRASLPGHVPRYFWGLGLEAGAEHRLGRLRFQAGASVAGWVVGPTSGALEPGRVEVSLAPLAAGDAVRDADGRRQSLELRRHRVRPDARGFFQLSGLAPGSYELVAAGDGLSPARLAPIEVLDGAESHLHEPLELGPPASLELALEPTFVPGGMPWHLTLLDVDRHEAVAEGPSDLAGFWRAHGLAAGDYLLVVRDGDERGASRIHTQKLELAPGETFRQLDLPILALAGELTFGGEPVAGTVWFGGRFGAESIRLQADDEGRFEGFVTHEGEWPVDVAVGAASMGQSLEPVVLERPDDGDAVFVELELPDTRLRGRVVDDEDRPVGAAQVRLISLEHRGKMAEHTTDLDGRFEIAGVRPGSMKIQAVAAEGESPMVDVVVEEGTEPPEVELVLDRMHTVVGRVESPQGPVPGALVAGYPSHALGVIRRAMTGGDGSFELRLPASSGEMDLLVLAPSHALAAFRLPVPSRDRGEPLALRVERASTRLDLGIGSTLGEVTLLAGDVPLQGHWLLRWLRLLGQEEAVWDRPLQLPRMAPGAYSLCAAAADGELECDQTYLAAGSVASLGVEPREPEPGAGRTGEEATVLRVASARPRP